MIKSLVNSIHQKHVDHQFYVLTTESEIQEVSAKKCQDPFSTAERLIILAQEETREGQERQILTGCAYDYLRMMKKQSCHLEGQEDRYKQLLAQALLLVFDRELSEASLDEIADLIGQEGEWYDFIVNNQVHYMVHRQQMIFSPDGGQMDQVCIDGQWYAWDQLEKRETETGFDFYVDDRLLFSTDNQLKLKGCFWAGDRGIIAGNLKKSEGLGEFFKRPATSKHWLTVYCVAKDSTNVQFGQSHVYLGLEDAEGNASLPGQYGLEKNVSITDIFAPLGKKRMGVETPDRYFSVPLAQHNVKEMRIEITKEEYERLAASIEKDKKEGLEGSLIKGNCATYVQNKLKLIGLQAKTTMTVQAYFARSMLKVLPKPLRERTVTWIRDKVPSWVKKVCLFCPLVYFPMIIVIGAAQILSGMKSDVSIMNAIFRPWKLEVDHPLAFFESLEQLQKETENFTIFRGKVEDSSAIGRSIEKAMGTLGLSQAAEGRLKLAQDKHITQHKVIPLPLMVIFAIFQAIKLKITNWMSQEKMLSENTLLLYLHSLKNQKFITSYQFQSLKESLHDKERLVREISYLVENFYQKKQIDRRALIHLKGLLNEEKTDQALSYVIAMGLVNDLNTQKHHQTMQDLITPDIQKKMTKYIGQYHKNYHFSTEAISAIEELSARVNCYEWVATLEDQETREELIKAVKSNDQSYFSLRLSYYFSKQMNEAGLPVTQKRILEEMMQAIKYPMAGNAFVNYAHLMQTQQQIAAVKSDLDAIYTQLQENQSQITEEVACDLKRLHQNMGLSLSADMEYLGSATLFSLMTGQLRGKWQEIDDLLVNIAPVIPSAKEKNSWPDIGFREIKPISLEKIGEAHSDPQKRKKVFFAYCSWGNGHRSVTSALTKSLGNDYRVATCDLPDEILLEKDPVFNLLGKKHSVTTLYNTLVAGNYWGTIRLMKKMGSAPTPQHEIEVQKDLIRRKLLQELPDVVVATYERHSHLLLEVAKELGIPFKMVYTDMVDDVSDLFRDSLNKDPEYLHQQISVPFNIEEANERLDAAGIDLSKVSYLGFPVRREFTPPMDKETLREKYGVEEEQKVILCLNGGCGGSIPWPKLIAKAKRESLGKCKVIVVCGKNELFYKEMQQLQSKDPGVEIEARGFVDAQTMAEICEIADLTISKPGGATVAENLLKKNLLVLDTRFSKELPWELETAQVLENRGLGLSLGSTKNFISTLQQALNQSYPEEGGFSVDAFNTEEKFIQDVEQLIGRAEEDKVLLERRHMTHMTPHYPIVEQRGEERSLSFDKNLAKFFLTHNQLNPREIIPSLKSALWQAEREKSFIRLNPKTNQFESCKEFSFEEIKYVCDLLKRELFAGEEVATESLEAVTEMLFRVKRKHKESAKKLTKELAFIDRHRVAKERQAQTEEETPSLEQAKALFKVPKAFKELEKWVGLKTSRSRRNPERYPDEMMLSEADAIAVFLNHPEEIDFVNKLYLHRKASAFNHLFTVEDHHLCIRYQGRQTAVADLIKRFNYVNDRIINVEDGREFTYAYAKGLTAIEEGQHPVNWQGEIPLFKVKENRKSQDYRLELMTTLGGKEVHGWVRLKDPSGHVYSLGKFWDPDYQLEDVQRFTSLPGYVKAAGDLQEFLGEEKHWKRTKIILNKEQFEKMKKKIVEKKQEDTEYNVVNRNCVTFCQELLSELGVKLSVSENAGALYMLPKFVKKFLIQHNLARHIMEVVFYPFRLLQNTLFVSFGMGNRNDIAGNSTAGFSKPWHFFTWQRSLVDHPSQLRLVQEILEEKYAGEDGKIDGRQLFDVANTQLIAQEVLF